MSRIIDLKGFKCTNHSVNVTLLSTGRFDVYNPCSWCKNHKTKGKKGASFHYIEYGHWEFPFIAEENCQNFSLISSNNINIDPKLWKHAMDIHNQRNKISEMGRKYSNKNWAAYSPSEVSNFMGDKLHSDEITYPHKMSPTEFFREASTMRIEMFELVHSLRETSSIFHKKMGIRDSQIDNWLMVMSGQLGEITRQIDELESKKSKSGLSIFSSWAFSTVSGGIAWDGLKEISQILARLMRE